MRSAIEGGMLMHRQTVMFPSGGHMFRIAAGNPRLVPPRSCPGGLQERREPRSASARDRSYRRQGQA